MFSNKQALTWPTRWGRGLEAVASELAPADGVDVRGLVVHPLVELVLPAVKVDEKQAAHVPPHGGHTHQPRLDQVHRLQLHVGGEAVARVVLDVGPHTHAHINIHDV